EVDGDVLAHCRRRGHVLDGHGSVTGRDVVVVVGHGECHGVGADVAAIEGRLAGGERLNPAGIARTAVDIGGGDRGVPGRIQVDGDILAGGDGCFGVVDGDLETAGAGVAAGVAGGAMDRGFALGERAAAGRGASDG